MFLRLLHLSRFRVRSHLLKYLVYLLHLQVDNIIHDTLSQHHMLVEKVKIEISILRKRIHHIRIQIHRQQAATVIRAQRYLPARIRRHRLKAQVRIAIRYRFPDNRIPEQYPRLGRLPRVMHDFLPYFLGIDTLGHLRVLGIDRVSLYKRLPGNRSPHKLIADFYRDIRTGNLALRHLGIDKRLRIRMLYRHAQHQRPATSVLSHLPCRVGITLHKRNQARRGQSRILYRSALRPDMRQVMTHTSAAFHQLYLFLIYLDNSAVRIGRTVHPDNKAIRQRSNLIIIADSAHRAALRHDIAEMVQQLPQLCYRKRVGILVFNPGNFARQSLVHIVRSLFIDIPVGIFERILVHPHTCGQLIALKIL